MSSVLIPRELLEHLDELAGLAEMESFGAEMKLKNPELNNLAHEVYMVTHWYLSPACRNNHPSWEPLSRLPQQDTPKTVNQEKSGKIAKGQESV